MEIVPSVHLLNRGRRNFNGVHASNIYLITGKTAAVFDSGVEDADTTSANLSQVQELGFRPSVVVLSHHHIDHIGGAALMRERTGAKVLAHPLEAASLKYSVDIPAEDGYRLDLDGLELEMVHTPGHSSGHLCAYLPQLKVLFSGDHILGLGTTAVILPQGNMSDYIESLRKLLKYDIRLICPGHGPLIHSPKLKIEELIAHRLEREKQVLKLFRRGMKDLESLTAELYPELDGRMLKLARGQIKAHLLKLEQEGFLSLR